jgi:hypothetical protein
MELIVLALTVGVVGLVARRVFALIRQQDAAASAAPGRVSRGLVALVTAGVAVGAWWYFSQPRFSDEEIADVRASIRAKYEASGVTVAEVSMIREDARKLVGFARLTAAGHEISKDCTATRDETSYLWRCR